MIEGVVLSGRYRLEREIGSGGIGIVYRATDQRTGGTVAVKVLHPHLARDTDFVRRFHRGARVARKLRDRHIVQVLDHGSDGDRHFLVMEFVQGKPLSEVLRQREKLHEKEARAIALQVALALDAAHQQGVVHRDISPGNILITRNDSVKVSDFDVAKATDATRMTQTGLFVGKVRYGAPEAFLGRTDIRSDIYSLGIVLYEMLTGHVPFDSDSPFAVVEMHRSLEPPRMEQLDRLGVGTLAAVIRRCLEKRAEQRFQSPRGLLLALEGRDVRARVSMPAKARDMRRKGSTAARPQPVPAGPRWPAPDRRRHNARYLVLGAGSMLVVAAVLVGGALLSPSTIRGGIAFVSTRDSGFDDIHDIYVMNADGSGATNLSDNSADDFGPAWSPDGSKIAFTSNRNGGYDIYVMSADGSGVVRLTDDPAYDRSPAWSPDGTKIAFISDSDGNDNIYVMSADGSGLVGLTDDPAYDRSPAWSSDGTKIAFDSMRDGYDNIYVMNADGTGVVHLTDGPAYDRSPAWSPDGTKIAFVSYREGNNGEIFVMNTDGSGVVRLSNDPAFDGSPAWSSDGTKIAFESMRSGDSQIYVMNADGSGVVRLTEEDASDPSWALLSQ